jgi:hypothetical protein
MVLRSLDRDEEAAEDEERACALASKAATSRSWLGLLRSTIESQAHLAESDLTRALEFAPRDPVIVFQRAVYYEFVQRWDDAIAGIVRRHRLTAPQSIAKSCPTRSLPRIRARRPPWRRRIRCPSFRSTLGREAR